MKVLPYIDQRLATDIDIALMKEIDGGYTLEQLMELAGYSVAQCIYDSFPPFKIDTTVIVCCGPGNNGGDGLVAARHLMQFGYRVNVHYPIVGKNSFYKKLLQQLFSYEIPVLDEPPDFSKYDIIVDAIFGFGFKGVIRPPFDTLIQLIKSCENTTLVSVDVPSGWVVDSGEDNLAGLKPDCLISLTFPKICARNFNGIHYLCGRFLSESILKQFNLESPAFPGSAGFVKL
ncbi:putative apolipoprotein A-I binding protein [Cardiosporidium cionae]|uniref:NAD(P)H-hydrate epimerase n=1 Tax=Cardiosporidium cionae TaxID=476202 RepID=A0ABQ7JD85_9APIC|nr:putative apolipoprotein A-I binding protein [Cardiosporidium cionae]|eukprot:KAF8821982.1 putative apolipoprotein A-I binding protein [Cardiosporidium cionae]